MRAFLLALLTVLLAPSLRASPAPVLAQPQVTAGGVSLSWSLSPSVGVSAQNVYRCAVVACVPVAPSLATLNATVATFTDTTATIPGTTYSYAVTATCPTISGTACQGESALSNIVAATIATVTPPPVTNSTFKMTVTPATLKFSGQAGAALAAQTVTIDDNTPSALPIAVTTDAPWLVLKCTTANTCVLTKAIESVTVNTIGMAAGTYTAHIIGTETAVEANGDSAGNSPQSATITLTLTAPPPPPPSLSINCTAVKAALTFANIPAGTPFNVSITSDGLTELCSGTF